MANILKDDVQTYVRELIEKGFESNRVEEMGLSQNRAFYPDGREHGKDRHACDHSLGEVHKTDARFGKS
jgi:hypothetical protein